MRDIYIFRSFLLVGFFIVGGIQMNAQISLDTSGMVVTNPDCGLSNGSVIGITATGGQTPYTYIWDSAGVVISNSFSANLNNVYPGFYTLTAVDANLDTARFGIRLTALGIPNFTITATDTIICAGQNVTINATGFGGGFIVWTGQGISPQFGTSINVSPNSTTTYFLSWNNGPCIVTDSIRIQVVSPPQISAQPDTVCPGDTATLSAALPPGFGGLVVWSGGDLAGPDTGQSIQVTPSTAQTYQVNWTSGGCSSVSSVSVAISNSPPIQITPLNPSTCAGSSVTLAASAAGVGGLYTWSGGSLAAPVNGDTVSVSPSSNETFTVTWTNGGCTSTDSVTVQVGQIPIWVNTTGDTICLNSSTTLFANGPSNGSYTWSGGDLSAPLVSNSVLVSPTQTQIYDLNWSDGVCSADTTVQVTVLNVQTIFLSSIDPSCGNNNGQIVVAGTGGSSKYEFRFIQNGITIQQSSSSTLNNAGPGSYQILTIDQDYGCVSNPVNVSLVDTTSFPSVSLVVLDSVDCPDDSDGRLLASITGGSGVYSISWSHDGGLTDSIATNLISGQSYTVSVSDPVCTAPVSQSIVFPGPTDSINLNLSSIPDTCSNQLGGASVMPSGANGGPWTYFWSNGGMTDQISGLLGGTTYSVSVTDNKGCDQEANVTIGNVGAPDIIIQAQTDSLCATDENGFIQIALQGNNNPPYTYYWSHAGNENDALAEDLGPGVYTVTVVDGSGCQSISSPVNIYTFPSGSIQLGNDTSILKGQTIKIAVQNSSNVSSVNWGPDRYLAHTGFSAYVFPLQTTTYWVEGVSTSGCNAYDSLVVYVDTIPFSIYIPNVFSPNGDGVNDFYYVQAENVETFEMHIYDRWGNKVFESYDLSNRWDGTDLSGKILPAGVYAYIIYVRSFDTTEKEPVYSGNITLIR